MKKKLSDKEKQQLADVKSSNCVAKHQREFNKSNVMIDRKREEKKNGFNKKSLKCDFNFFRKKV